MSNYKIFIDTGADMPEEMAEKNGFGVIRFLSIFGEKSYVTGTDITNEQFYKMLKESDTIPTTSQTPYADFYDQLKKASDEYDTVIYFALSSSASGQYNTACMIKNEILEENPDADIRIFDTQTFSVYISVTALYAKELLDSGMDVDTVLDKCREYIKTWQCYILVDTLKYLEKGGRITKTSAIVGSLLDIKPVLTINNGLIEPVEKLRGNKKLFKKLLNLVRENPDFDDEK
ncbi:MAG: DegV family protein, partial [Clostridia bacterium]|nr:DegV family protein [Clostridia bacterium]